MLKYLVRFARNPVKSRRNIAMRLLIGVAIFVVGPPLLNWCVHPRGGFAFDFSLSGVLIVATSVFSIVFWAPVLAAYSRPRRQRERYLTRSVSRSQLVGSVYLTPNLLGFIEREAKTRLSPYTESVSLMSTSSAIEFWSGGASPIRTATMDFIAIDLVRFVEDEEHFPRPEIRTNVQTIPLYAAVGWLRISR